MQKIYYTSLFTAVLLAFITNNTFAQTTWTGASDTDWANTANWSAGVPDATDDVTIPGSVPNNPTIGAAGALANSVNVQTSATLTINATGSLTINGSRFFNTSSSASTAGFYNEGTVSNSGNLILGSSASVGIFGIQNFATFNNNSGGEISIDRSTLSGLENSTGIFTNAAKITIGAVASVGSYGIENFATFNNNSGGEICIDRSSGNGLYNRGDKFRVGTFTNAAKITIGAVASAGEYGIENFTTFNNNSGGEISIDQSTITGLRNLSGTFTNAAKITIGAVASVGNEGIRNQGTFNNSTCIAIIRIASDAIVNNTGTFSNAGLIIENASGNSSITSNTGIVQNLNGGTFAIGTNTGLLTTSADPINACCYITGPTTVCTGAQISLNLACVAGGTWSSSNMAVATVNASTGVVTGVSGGTATISYTAGSNTATTIVTVSAPPNAAIAITENNVIFNPFTNNAYYNASYTDGILCTGPAVPNPSTSATLTASGGGTYLWSNNATTAAITVSTAGTYTVTVTTAPGCTSTAARTISVNSAPNPGTISATPQINSFGGYGVCWGSTIQLSSTVSGGVWSAQPHNPQIVSISSDGIVTPLFTSISVDTNSVYYTVTSLGCYNSSRPQVMVIDPRNPGTISGNTNLCPGNPSQLTSNGQSGGVWFSSNTTVATVSSNGLVTPLSNGTTTISYTLYGFSTNPATACPYSATALVTVAPCCAGPAALCKPANAVLVGNSATILPASVDNGSTAACGLQSITVSPNTFNCSQIGTPQTVTLTVTDVNNASNACTATVTVIDNTPPSITCPPNATVNANASCQGTVGAYSAATLADNCNPLPTVTQSPASSTVMTGHNTAQTVTLTANDGNGNTATCSLTVTLKDVTPPTVICPGNQFANVGANCIAPMPNYAGSLSYLDNCSSTSNTQTPAAGTPLSLGTTTTLTLIVSDMAGNTASCVFNVTARDVIPPSITCPPNTTVAANASCQNTIGAYGAATLSDNCNPSPAVTQSPASSTILTGHNTAQTVTLTANDGNGNTATCALVVTLKDITPPTITCPANAAVQASANCAATLASYTAAATANDNCTANPSKTQSPVSGTTITGSQVVTLTATDAANNSTACTFTVTVVDQTAPSITCPANATVPAGANCTAILASYTAAATANDNCTANPSKTQSPVSGTIITGSQVVTLTATDAANNSATCTFTVTVVDQTVPSITCPANTTVPAGATCAATLASYTAAATANDNCTVNPSKTQSPVFGTIITGSQVVTLTATDAANNSATCTFTVTVVDATAPTVICKNFTTNLNAAGAASITTANVFQSGSDNCGTVNQVLVLPNTFTCANKGTNTVVLTVSDGASNTATCSAIVTVVDATAPTIICPANIVRANDLNQCNALVVYPIPITSDNCAGAVASHFSGGVSGAVFPKGTTIVIWRATDGAGLTGSCSFSITINDTQKPNITCPVNQTRSTDLGQCSAVVTYPTPTGTDNCGLPTGQPVWISGGTNASGSTATFQKGATNVIWQATDAAGNAQTCSFRVTVNDTQAPTMTCPAAISLSTATNTCSAVATYTNPSFTDNCAPTTGTAIRISGLVSGSAFPVGNSNVVFQATDAAGNTRRCTMVVTVTDNQPPVVTCPPSIIVNGSSTPCMSTVFFANATASDNCAGTLTPFLFSGLASGSAFPAGVTTNTFRAVAPNGQSANCSFTVTVNCGSGMGNEGLEDRNKELEALQTMTHKTSLGLTVAPNPAIYSVTMSIEGVDANGGTLLVFDQIGRLVQQQIIANDQRTTTLQVAEFAPGLYRIMLKTGDGTVTKTLVVVKE